jgi:tetratricopeptide (TPR) repeat protein
MATFHHKIGILVAAASCALASCSEPPVTPRRDSAPEEVKYTYEVGRDVKEIPGFSDYWKGAVEYNKFKTLLYNEEEKDKTSYRDLPLLLQKKKEMGVAVDTATLQQMEKRLNAAIQFLKAATETNPKFGRAFLVLGFSYYQLRRYEEALSAYRRVLEIHPKAANTYYSIALCYLNMGKKKEALDCANEALKIDPNNKEARLLIDRISESNKR